jgi:hypothetical protein
LRSAAEGGDPFVLEIPNEKFFKITDEFFVPAENAWKADKYAPFF